MQTAIKSERQILRSITCLLKSRLQEIGDSGTSALLNSLVRQCSELESHIDKQNTQIAAASGQLEEANRVTLKLDRQEANAAHQDRLLHNRIEALEEKLALLERGEQDSSTTFTQLMQEEIAKAKKELDNKVRRTRTAAEQLKREHSQQMQRLNHHLSSECKKLEVKAEKLTLLAQMETDTNKENVSHKETTRAAKLINPHEHMFVEAGTF